MAVLYKLNQYLQRLFLIGNDCKSKYQDDGLVQSTFMTSKQLLKYCLPNRCILCHLNIDAKSNTNTSHNGICSVCLQENIYTQGVCLGCGKIMLKELGFCGHCLGHAQFPIISAASYYSELGSLISAIKYHRQFAPLNSISNALCQRIDFLLSRNIIQLPQAIIPVPMHKKRLQERGFNQAFLIAKQLAKYFQVPLDNQSLTRIIDTPQQAGLDGKARRKNLRNAFYLTPQCPWQSIALVDDVVTTGTTVKVIHSYFLKQGIHVQVWCLARAEGKNNNTR